MSNSTPEQLRFPSIDGLSIRADFKGGALSTDFGPMLLRVVDRQIGLTEHLARAFDDRRHASYTDHSLSHLMAQRIYQIACGYEDGNDAHPSVASLPICISDTVLCRFPDCIPGGNVHYQLKTPYRDGTTHVIFEPLDFIARLAALIPRPRANLTRFHGVFVGVPHQPNSKHRTLVTPSKRGKSPHRRKNGDERSPVEQHAAMSWAHQK